MHSASLPLRYFFVAWITAGLLSGCGSSGGSTPAATTTSTTASYFGTQSPGDVWTWTLTGTSFTATNKTKNYTYSGTESKLQSGFLKLVVSTTTDPGVTPPATAYAVEIPNTALLVQPAGANPKVIVAAAGGTCPTASATYNWVTIPSSTWASNSSAAYGTVASTVTGSSFSFNINPNLFSGTPLSAISQSGWSCSNGTFTNNSSAYSFGITPSGVFIGDKGPSAGGMIGVVQPATNINITDMTSKNYLGFQFSTDPNVIPNVTEPIAGTPGASAGQIIGTSYTNVETNTLCSPNCTGTINLTTQSSPGQITGTVTSGGGGTRNIIFNVSQVNGVYLAFGLSTTGSGTPYNFMVAQQ